MNEPASIETREDSSPFPFAGPDELRLPIQKALGRVVDPELALTIVDVGLVYGVVVDARQVQVRVTMTSAACPVVDVIIDDIGCELSRVVPESLDIDVQLVWEPPWTPDRMSGRAKRAMGW